MNYNPRNVTTVVFDWGGVFCNPAEPFASVALQTALCMNPDEIAEDARDIYDDHYRGVYTTEEFWQKILEHFKLDGVGALAPSELSKAYIGSYGVYPEMLEIAGRLRGKYSVALISNLSPVMRDHIKIAHKTEGYFNPEVYSCDPDIRAIKPDEEIFRTFLRIAQKSPKECLFVDDSQKNLDAATILGFQTLLFIGLKQFIRDIAPLL